MNLEIPGEWIFLRALVKSFFHLLLGNQFLLLLTISKGHLLVLN